MRIKGLIAAAALAAICQGDAMKASAAEFSVLSGFVSKHSGDKQYNETNNGIGFRIDSGDWKGWVVGTFRNSLWRQTFYAGKEWQRHVAGPLSVGLFAGAATGYNYVVIPAALPEVILRFDVLELAMLVQPLNLKDSPSFAALQVRLRF